MGADDWKVPVEELKGRLNTVAATVDAHIVSEEKQWERQDKVNGDLGETAKRPTWGTTIALSALASGVVGLTVALINQLAR